MSDIIQFPNSKNITEPKPVDVLDHVISTLEAIQGSSAYIRNAVDVLKVKQRIRKAAEIASE